MQARDDDFIFSDFISISSVRTSFVNEDKVHQKIPESMMMMIAFITIKSSLVPLIEGLCAQI